MPEAPVGPVPFRLSSRAGMSAEVNANGSLRRFDCEAISLALFVGNEIEGGPTNLYLRRLTEPLEWTPLLGPLSNTRFTLDAGSGAPVGFGAWRGIHYSIALVLAKDAPAWFWHVWLENTNPTVQQVDLTYAQDLALAPYGAVRLNEYYVSQYIDHTPLQHGEHGVMIASRQNQAADGRYPWSVIGSLRAGASFATDAIQFHGLAGRAGASPVGLSTELPNRRLQHEHSMVVIRDIPVRLDPNTRVKAGFFGSYLADHPTATSPVDLDVASKALALPEATPTPPNSPVAETAGCSTLFSSAAVLNGLDADTDALERLFPLSGRHGERDERGRLLSFFNGAQHTVLREKELRVQRPHGHLLRTGRHTTPDESGLTSTVWMSGVFHSMLTQGHVSINRFLSTTHSYIGLFRSHGQRVFVQIGDTWRLLNVPSAFEMSPNAARWIYLLDEGMIEVRAEARSDPHELTLSIHLDSGRQAQFLISHHVALNGDDGSAAGAARWRHDCGVVVVTAAPASDVGRRFPNGTFRIAPFAGTQFQRVGGDELLFNDGISRQQPYLCILTAPANSVGLSIRGHLIAEEEQKPLRAHSVNDLLPDLLPSGPTAEQLLPIHDMVPWYTHNAWVHYLSPRGLEQYSGGGWGTRDVCQGPVELLLALNRLDSLRDLLIRVLRAQNADGDWPQWFMFFERERNIRPDDSHGDIVFWPLLALGQYLIASGDADVLDERVPFFDQRDPESGERATVWQHVQRALSVIERRTISGTALPAYGHGDWNDSLQPVDPRMRDRLCSAWTVTLHFQTLSTLARALRAIGRTQDAIRLETWSEAVKRDFQRLLIVDGVLAGYAVFETGRPARYLLHPSDQTTGIQYSALAITHAILEDLLAPAQTLDHLRLIDQHLSAPDGVRLFDRPMPYHGGPQRLFQRAESATFFGREIGLMYTHAHLRYAQALARVGDAERFFRALRQANPIGIRSIVPSASLRQANCYYSSSDAAFEDRYQASAEYERVARGTVALDGGWRVYSSGAGIALGLIIRRLLGLDQEASFLRIDPVMPRALDGLEVATPVLGHMMQMRYRIAEKGCGVSRITLNDQPLPFTSDVNPHRRGAALVPRAALLERVASGYNRMTIELG